MNDRDAQAVRDAAGLHRDHRPPWTRRLLDPWCDERTIGAMRLLLALAALVVTWSVGRGPGVAGLIYVLLALYSVYSAVVYVILHHGIASRIPAAHWIDVAWYTAFTAVAGGTISPFFSFYYFAILIASFRGGLRAGVQVTVASALLFTAVGYLMQAPEGAVPTDRFLLRPTYLLIIGFMMARWGNIELLSRRRLVLLKEVSSLANPRFGAGQSVGALLDRLSAFHDADMVLLAVADADGRRFSVRRTHRGSPGSGVIETPVSTDWGAMLTSIPWTQALVFGAAGSRTMDLDAAGQHDTPAQCVEARGIASPCAEIAAILNCRSFVSVPLRFGTSAMARLYVASNKPVAFGESDAAFLVMVVDQVMPAIERLRLLDGLAVDAAAQERQRLSRNLHDSVIQPYIGLHIGIAAALEQARRGNDLVPTLERLQQMAEQEIAGLRHYARDLKNRHDASGGLVAGVRRIAASFAQASDIRVDVTAPPGLVVEDRLAAEVFQLVAEGISNVRRHTSATRAGISLERRADHLVVRIENAGAPGEVFRPFVPRSIGGRAQALGGFVRVLGRPDGGASVHVAIPV